MATKKSSGIKPSPAGKKSNYEQKTSRSPQAAVAFWLIFFVVLAGLVFIQRATIKENYNILAKRLKLPVLISRDSSAAENPAPEETPAETITQTPPPAAPRIIPAAPDRTPAPQPAPVPVPERPATQPVPPAPQPAAPAPAVPRPAAPAAPAAKPVETRERSLYFTQVGRDGTILRIKVSRNIAVSDSPLVDSLKSLLAGPTAEEAKKGLLNLIPPHTKILSATVRGTTAYINFSEDFQFNTYGVEGYAAQLRQIVWTATEFSTVKDVQILIEGRRIDYLGEGIWIGSPISRESLF